MKLTIYKIAELVEGDIQGDGSIMIQGVAPFEHASSTDITFAGSSKFLKRIEETDAGAVIVPRDFNTLRNNSFWSIIHRWRLPR